MGAAPVGIKFNMNQKQLRGISAGIEWLLNIPGSDADNFRELVAELASRERRLTAAAKAVVEASKGTDEAAMDEAIDQLKKSLK
jgi:hypothetical protein